MESGVLLVAFDLPTDTSEQRKDYRFFVKGLKRIGYVMLQESLYGKPLRNSKLLDGNIRELDEFLPKSGDVKALFLTKGQYESLRNVLGVKAPPLDFSTTAVL